MHYRHRETVYHIKVVQTPAGHGPMRVSVDGVERQHQAIPLVDDHQEHWAEVWTPARPAAGDPGPAPSSARPEE